MARIPLQDSNEEDEDDEKGRDLLGKTKKAGKDFLEFAEGAQQNFAENEFPDSNGMNQGGMFHEERFEFMVSSVGDLWQVTAFDPTRRMVDRFRKKNPAVNLARSLAQRDKPSTLLVLRADKTVEYERNFD